MAVLSALKRVPLLQGLQDADLEDLAHNLDEREVKRGDKLIAKGRGGIAFLILLDGRAEVSIEGEIIRTLGPGEHFGETSLLDPSVERAATVTALTNLRLVRMSPWQFKIFVMGHPEIAWRLLEYLAQRVSEAQRLDLERRLAKRAGSAG
jgi:CRP/FNR family cyclic AMP-dependent transcriptional regulator